VYDNACFLLDRVPAYDGADGQTEKSDRRTDGHRAIAYTLLSQRHAAKYINKLTNLLNVVS